MNDWKRLYPGVYRMRVGRGKLLSPYRALSVRPNKPALEGYPEADVPNRLIPLVEERGGRVIVSLPLADKERIYGFGLQYFTVDQRGRTRYLRVNSDPAADTGETNAPCNFYLSTSGYGLYFDTARVVTAHCGSTALLAEKPTLGERDCISDESFCYTPPSGRVELCFSKEGAVLYLFLAGSPFDVVCKRNLFFGGGVLPPKWALGFWHRTPASADAKEAARAATELRERGFGCSVLGLEPGWQSNSYPCSLTFSETRFPDPAGFVEGLKAEGVRVNAWQHPYLSEKCPIYPAMRPYAGSHTVWGGLVPDLLLPEAARLLRAGLAAQLDAGVAGMKLDECDGSENTKFSWMFPAHAAFPSGTDGERQRQLLGGLFQRAAAEAYAERGARTFGLARASGDCCTALPFAVYSDLYDVRQYVRAAVNAGFCGLLWVPEVRTAESAEEWAGRFFLAALSPVFQLNAWCDGLMPWSFPEAEGKVREAFALRRALLPYLYTLFYRYRSYGEPPVSGVQLTPGFSAERAGEAYRRASGYEKRRVWDTFDDEIDFEFMLGRALLAAPLPVGGRLVYLPPGAWRSFHTGERYAGDRFVRAEDGRAPLFVREGTILPLMGEGEDTLTLRVYGETAAGELYDDDGESRKGPSARWEFRYAGGKGSARRRGGYRRGYRKFIWEAIGGKEHA